MQVMVTVLEAVILTGSAANTITLDSDSVQDPLSFLRRVRVATR